MSEKPKPKVIEVQPISAISVDTNKLTQQVNKIKADKARKKRTEEKRVKDLESRAAKAKSKRRNEENKIKSLNKKTRQSQAAKRKADAATKKAKAKQKREQKKANNAAAAAKKKLKEKRVADKAAADAKTRRIAAEKKETNAKAARIAKAKRDKELKAKRAKEARERREQELALQQQMADEAAARNKARQQQVLSEKNKYKALILQRINQSTRKEESMRGKSCKLKIKLAFNGLVTSVKILEGDPRVCQAVESGVYKAGKLPVSKDPAVFEELKNITITYLPDFN
jgi:colicin import membrane protein